MERHEVMAVLREGLAALPTDVSHVVGRPPTIDEIFTPYRHSLAIDPDLPIVVGARGTGKSFWASVFTDNALRASLASRYPRLHLDDVVARPGFVDQALPKSVSRNTLDEILGDNPAQAGKLWLLVALRAAEDVVQAETFHSYAEGLEVYRSSEVLEARLREMDNRIAQMNLRLVIVFDALDRLSNDWEAMRSRTTALLETLLSLRAYRSIKFKLFMRPEQLSSVPAAFTDLSKLRAGAFDLRWSAIDLYGLAFTQLLRRPATRDAFTEMLDRLRVGSVEVSDDRESLPVALLRGADAQERVFATMAGHYMGSDARRGRTYTWLPKHLSDTKGRLTPRSFLLALGEAARHERLPSGLHALTVEGIKHGVSAASVLRVQQLKDEYGWINLALQPLAGQEVPCEAYAIYNRWYDADTLYLIRNEAEKDGYLPPFPGDYDDPDSVVDLLSAMMDIGIIELRADKRVNIPDLFRIAALMLRRGGPAPLPQR